jgi:uncharacterized OB-fold protein
VMTKGISASQCLRCGKVFFPNHTRCRSCRSTEFKEVSLRTGRVVASTRLTATRPGFASELVLAVAEFEKGVRVLGQVRGDMPQTGSVVEVEDGVLGRKGKEELRGFTFVLGRPSR